MRSSGTAPICVDCVAVNSPLASEDSGKRGVRWKSRVWGRCSKCKSTIGMIERAALASGVEVTIVKYERPEDIHGYGIHATPAVVFDGKFMHSAGLPSHGEVPGWLKPTPSGF